MERYAIDAALETFDGMRVLASLQPTPAIIESMQDSAEAIKGVFKALAAQGNGEVLTAALKSYAQVSDIALNTVPPESRGIIAGLTDAVHAICGLNK